MQLRTISSTFSVGVFDGLPTLPDRFDGSDFCVALHSSLSRRKVAALFRAPGWHIRKCSWTDYEVTSPFAELIIEGESPILMHGPIADPEVNVDRILAILRRAGVAYEGECYDAGDRPLQEFRWGID